MIHTLGAVRDLVKSEQRSQVHTVPEQGKYFLEAVRRVREIQAQLKMQVTTSIPNITTAYKFDKDWDNTSSNQGNLMRGQVRLQLARYRDSVRNRLFSYLVELIFSMRVMVIRRLEGIWKTLSVFSRISCKDNSDSLDCDGSVHPAPHRAQTFLACAQGPEPCSARTFVSFTTTSSLSGVQFGGLA